MLAPGAAVAELSPTPVRPLDRFDSWTIARAAQLLPDVLQSNGAFDLDGVADAALSAARRSAAAELSQTLLSDWAMCLRMESYKYRSARTPDAHPCGAAAAASRVSTLQAACSTALTAEVPLTVVLHSLRRRGTDDQDVLWSGMVQIPEQIFLTARPTVSAPGGAEAEVRRADFWHLGVLKAFVAEQLGSAEGCRGRQHRLVRLRCSEGGAWRAVCDAADLSAHLCRCTDLGLVPGLYADCFDEGWLRRLGLPPGAAEHPLQPGGLPRAAPPPQRRELRALPTDFRAWRAPGAAHGFGPADTPPSGPAATPAADTVGGSPAVAVRAGELPPAAGAAPAAAPPAEGGGDDAGSSGSEGGSLGEADCPAWLQGSRLLRDARGVPVGPACHGDGSYNLGSRQWAVVVGRVDAAPAGRARLGADEVRPGRGEQQSIAPWNQDADPPNFPRPADWELRDVWLQVRAKSGRLGKGGKEGFNTLEAELPRAVITVPAPAKLVQCAQQTADWMRQEAARPH
eukprot:TRINITY_DN38638_c0_g1_i1.p1 TRINITY_DN38638_c0_g1~~TRINITY_DN38638_c0_g1_i1.p1  ORF type:complete len:531 (+),score=148.44 TRINITY_DN38638_c0_g1_i1:57-1595(+)